MLTSNIPYVRLLRMVLIFIDAWMLSFLKEFTPGIASIGSALGGMVPDVSRGIPWILYNGITSHLDVATHAFTSLFCLWFWARACRNERARVRAELENMIGFRARNVRVANLG